MTPREKAAALLADALVMVGIAHENVSSIGTAEQWLPDTDLTSRALAASPALAAALELGVAWQMAEAALPEGWRFKSVTGWVDDPLWQAQALHPRMAGIQDFRHGDGPTPTEALAALAAALEADRA